MTKSQTGDSSPRVDVERAMDIIAMHSLMGADTSLDEAMNKLRNTLDHITTLEAENARLRAERIDAVQAARYHEAKSAKLRAVVDAARALRDATKRHIEENISPIQAAAEGGWLCDQMFDALSALEGDQS